MENLRDRIGNSRHIKEKRILTIRYFMKIKLHKLRSVHESNSYQEEYLKR